MSTEENRTKVTILTESYRVTGYIHIVSGARVTDYMVDAKGFIAMTDGEVRDLEGRKILTAPFLNLSRNHIQIVMPA